MSCDRLLLENHGTLRVSREKKRLCLSMHDHVVNIKLELLTHV